MASVAVLEEPAPGRVRRLVTAGLLDSFGLSLGWTVFNLHTVEVHGLGAVGLLNAAMLTGVALSAPAAGWIAARAHGRWLLRGTAIVEALLRLATFLMLIAGAPLPAIAAVIVIMNVVSWTAYAGMRAEVAAADPRASAMTWYAVAILSIEALGAATAAVLPTGPDGLVSGGLLIAVTAAYAASLVPQFVVAQGALVAAAPRVARPGVTRRRLAPLGVAAAIMLVGSGPALLAVGLAAELHGRTSVAAAAGAFTLGTLLAPGLAALVERRGLAPSATWPLFGAGMVIGWVAAPSGVAGLLAAQLLSGLSMSAFEGTVDVHVAADTPAQGGATAGLAWSAAARALGGAVAVGGMPSVVAATGLGIASGAAGLTLLAAAAAALLIGIWRSDRAPARLPAAVSRSGTGGSA